MAEFVMLKKKDRVRLFHVAKKNTKLSFNKLYPLFEISRTSFFNYYSRGWPIPFGVFKKLEDITKIKATNYKLIKKERFLKHNIKVPELNESLSELIGALNGDGHISKHKYELNIVSDSREKEYHQHLKKLFKKTFGIVPSLFNIRESTIKLRVYSVDIVKLLTKIYSLPIGKKKGKLKIPSQILSSRKFLIAYIKGLFDTDGSFYIRRKRDPVVEIISADKRFLKEVRNVLISLGFNAGMSGKHVYIYNKDHINNFFKIIKPANSKHLKKFEIYSNQAWIV